MINAKSETLSSFYDCEQENDSTFNTEFSLKRETAK